MNIPKWSYIATRGSGERTVEWPKLPFSFMHKAVRKAVDQTEHMEWRNADAGQEKKKENGNVENNMTDSQFIFSWRYFQK